MAVEADYFNVNRRLLKSDLWLSEPFTRGQAWVDLVGSANWKEGFVRINGARVDLARGEVAASLRYLAKRWKWSKGKVARFILELKTDTRIGTREHALTSIISITNYDSYQINGTAIDPLTGHHRDSHGTLAGQSKEGKEGKEGTKRERTGSARPESLDDVLAYFAERGSDANEGEAFWDHFESNGWKVGGKAAMKDWKASARGWLRRNFGKPQPASATVCRPPTDEELANYNPYG